MNAVFLGHAKQEGQIINRKYVQQVIQNQARLKKFDFDRFQCSLAKVDSLLLITN